MALLESSYRLKGVHVIHHDSLRHYYQLGIHRKSVRNVAKNWLLSESKKEISFALNEEFIEVLPRSGSRLIYTV